LGKVQQRKRTDAYRLDKREYEREGNCREGLLDQSTVLKTTAKEDTKRAG